MNAVEILALGSSPKRAASAEVGAPNKEETSFLGEIEALDDEAPVSDNVKADADSGKAELQDEGDLSVEVADLDTKQIDTLAAPSEEGQVGPVIVSSVDKPVPQDGAENVQLPASPSPSGPPSEGVGAIRPTIFSCCRF